MTGPSIEAVLFDMDGVLYAYDFENRLKLLEDALGVSANDIRTKIFDSGFEDSADTGALTLDAYYAGLSARLGVDVSPRQWLAARKWSMAPEPMVIDFARHVARRLPTALLTHNGPMMSSHLAECAPELPDIFGENLFVTSDLGSGKEDAQTFIGLCERLGWQPEATLFIDDNPDFLAGAEAAGLQTYLFDGIDGLREHFRGQGPET